MAHASISLLQALGGRLGSFVLLKRRAPRREVSCFSVPRSCDLEPWVPSTGTRPGDAIDTCAWCFKKEHQLASIIREQAAHTCQCKYQGSTPGGGGTKC